MKKVVIIIIAILIPSMAKAEGLNLKHIYECTIRYYLSKELCPIKNKDLLVCGSDCRQEIISKVRNKEGLKSIVNNFSFDYCLPENENDEQIILKFVDWYNQNEKYRNYLYSEGLAHFASQAYKCSRN